MAPKACNYNGGKLHWHPAAIDDGVVLFSSDRHHIVFANWMRKAVRKIYGGDSTLNGLVGFTIDDRHCSCVCLLSGTVRWPQWLHLHGAGQTDQGFFDLERFDPPVKVDLAAMWMTFSGKLPRDARVRRDAAGRANGPIYIEIKRTSLLSPTKGEAIGTWHFHLWYEHADAGEPLVFEFNPSATGKMKVATEVRDRTFPDAKDVGIAAARQAAYGDKGWQGYRSVRASGPPPAYSNLAGPSAPQPARPHGQQLSLQTPPPPPPAPPPAPARPPPPAQISEAPVLVGELGDAEPDLEEVWLYDETCKEWIAKATPPVKSPPPHPPSHPPSHPVKSPHLQPPPAFKAPPAVLSLLALPDDQPVLVGPSTSSTSSIASSWEEIGTKVKVD